uniref:BESS domain-containing protein n=1 Tax=Loa loa TaxID=7209 RepID=A0A1I7VQF3_LOALO
MKKGNGKFNKYKEKTKKLIDKILIEFPKRKYFGPDKKGIMPRKKTYLIASLLDQCDTNDMKTINYNIVKPMEIINKECETLRKLNRDVPGCSDEERQQNVVPKSHVVPWRRALPMPIIRNQLQNFPGNESSQYFLYRVPVPTHLHALSPYNIPCLSQLMITRYQLMQMQQAAIQQLSSPSSSSTPVSSPLSLSTSSSAINQQILSNQSETLHLFHLREGVQSGVKSSYTYAHTFPSIP